MPLNALLDQAKHHPFIVAVALFGCIVVGGTAAAAYMKLSEVRLGMREEKIAVLGERLKLQEESSERQRHINKLVQEQMGLLRKGFETLPPAVKGVRTVLIDAERSGGLKKDIGKKLYSSLESVECQLEVLQTAVINSEALSKSLNLLVSGVISEERGQFAEAVSLYQQAAQEGNVVANTRLANLYLKGKGVSADYDFAIKLFEKSALLGDIDAKDEAINLYSSGRGVEKSSPIYAAALLSVQPSSEEQLIKLASIIQELNPEEKKKLSEHVELLKQIQNDIVKFHTVTR